MPVTAKNSPPPADAKLEDGLAKSAAKTRVQPASATPMAYVRVVVDAYQREGRSAVNALRTAQIAPAQVSQPDALITAQQMEALSGTAMHELDDEGLAAFSRKLPWGSYGMLARASLTSPNLGVAIKRWCRHHALLTDDVQLKLVTSGDTALVIIDERTPLGVLSVTAREFGLVHLLRNIHGLASWYIDSRIPLQGTHLPFAEPLHADAYRHMFPGPLRFGASQAEIRFDARYLALPLRRDERALRAMLRRALPLTVLQYRRDRLLGRRVRELLRAHSTDAVTAETVAGWLAISPRTLHRQLHDEGVSLQLLKDEVRRTRACELLRRTTRPLRQVALAVGFRNEKSFARAFRQWTGTTPGRFRSGAPD